MAKFPALPLFTDAYMADTRHLTAAQHGGYLLLLMTAWRMPDCKLPDDDVFLSRCASMDLRTWKKNKDAIMTFWKKDETQKWYQARLVDERKYAEHVSNKNAESGRASALKRKERHSTIVQPKRNETSTPTPTPIPIPTNNKPPLVSPSRGTRISLDWSLPQEWGDWAEEQGLQPSEILREADKFKDWAISNGTVKKNWEATWRNWIRRKME